MNLAPAAAAIRRHLWQPNRPGPLGGRPWTMGRELQIFERLCKDHDPAELLGALAHVRAIANTKGPARMTWLVHPQRGPALLARAVAAFHAQAPPGPPRGGGLDRISVELPPPPLPRLLADMRAEIYADLKKGRDE